MAGYVYGNGENYIFILFGRYGVCMRLYIVRGEGRARTAAVVVMVVVVHTLDKRSEIEIL